MKHELAFTFLACADVKRVWEAIATTSAPWADDSAERVASADAFAKRLAHHCELLAANPEVGRPRDDLAHGLRSSGFERYKIFYRVRGERIELVRLLRADRDVTAVAA